MLCPNCGHTARPAPNTREARCGHCNFKLPENPQPQASPASMPVACWNCAHANPSEAERCAHCNAKIAAQPGRPADDRRFFFTQHAVHHDQ